MPRWTAGSNNIPKYTYTLYLDLIKHYKKINDKAIKPNHIRNDCWYYLTTCEGKRDKNKEKDSNFCRKLMRAT